MSLSLLLCQCGDSEAHNAKCEIVRLDQTLAQFPDMSAERQSVIIDSLTPEIDAMFRVMGYDQVTAESLDQWGRSQAVRVFQPDVDSVYRSIEPIESQLGYMLNRAEKDSLGIPHLLFATVTWGNPRPMVLVDSVMLIALNHYLGVNYPGYDQWPDYRRAEKTPAQLPYDLAAALVATRHPYSIGQGQTLLSWMLYEGVLVEARMRLVKDADICLALGYDPEQYRYLEDNCKKIWDEMAVRKLIYDTAPATIDRYITSAPLTPLLQSTTPGRIGRYIGYKIVRSYLDKHPDTSLVWMLSPAFYGSQQSLIDSGFSGR